MEKMYEKHRDSNSFREYQERKKLKRKHPVNHADKPIHDLIDVNDMVHKINENTGIDDLTKKSVHTGVPTNKYHENCKAGSSSIKPKTGTGGPPDLKRIVKKPLPFQNNYLKSGISKAKKLPTENIKKPTLRRYDNFLKSGKRTVDVTSAARVKNIARNATITKFHSDHVGNAGGNHLDDGSGIDDLNDVDSGTYFERTSTPIEAQEDHLNISSRSARRFQFSSRNDNDQTTENNNTKNPNVQEDIQIRPAVTSPQRANTFEEKVLKELSDLKKTQQSFEARIESRIETFINDQTRTQGNGQSYFQGSSRSRSHDSGRSHFQGNSRSFEHGNYQSGLQFQSRQYRGARNAVQIRHLEQDFPEHVHNFEKFEELDRNFPIRKKNTVPDLEFKIRKDLDFKFLMFSRLNELGGLDYKKCIREIMKYLFTNPVLECYTWRGTAEKDAFRQLQALNALILSSVRDRCPNTKLNEYKNYMGEWLRHSRTRQRKITYTYPEPMNMDDDFDEDEDEDDENLN